MRQLIALALCLCLALPVKAQESEIQTVIQNQIASFLRDDFATAFTFAAPNIVSLFRTPENFGRMVVNGYPMVHRPDSVEFQDLSVENGLHRQRVLFRDQSGVYYTAEYTMIEHDGRWKIAGVQIMRAPGIGV